MTIRISALVAALLLVIACAGDTGGSARPVTNVELSVYGAASLKDVLKHVEIAYAADQPGTTLMTSTDSSTALATQIEQGAPADVFLSADTTNPRRLVDAGLAAGDAVVFAANKLTIIVPADNPAGIGSPADLGRPGVKVIAAGAEVPITGYAGQVVDSLARAAGDRTDFAAAYASNVVSREDNVKAVVAKIELGEGDAGIVYVTDADASTKVALVDLPDLVNVSASYAGVVVRSSGDVDAARAFLAWLVGTDGQAILASFGFLPPP